MSTPIQDTIASLASKFADEVLVTLRTASVEDLLGAAGVTNVARAPRAAARTRTASRPSQKPSKPAARSNGRLARRGPEEINKMVDNIADLLKKNPAGMRSEQIKTALGWQAKEMPRPLAAALESKRVMCRGQRRATTYFLKGKMPGAKAAPAAKPSTKKKTKTPTKSLKTATKKATKSKK